MIERDIQRRLKKFAGQFPAITLTGPRQSGKSTLCRHAFPQHAYANLELPDVRSFAQDDPRGFLDQFQAGAILDEFQRVPDLASYLQGRIDADPIPERWILTGSQNLALTESVNQSLAGRTASLELLPLARSEIIRFPEHPATVDESLVTGGYPRILDQRLDAHEWLGAYIATYIERDVRQISNIGDLDTFQRFVELCAGRSGQLLNLSQLANDCGIAQPTAKAWLNVLEASFIVFRLPAYSSNIRKRLVKMPKLHFLDSGLACRLLGIRDAGQLRSHPLRGALFESWVVAEIRKHRRNHGETGGMYHYRDQHGIEADLVIDSPQGQMLVEAKAGQTVTPQLVDSVRRIGRTLGKEQDCKQVIVYAGQEEQHRTDLKILPWHALHTRDWV